MTSLNLRAADAGLGFHFHSEFRGGIVNMEQEMEDKTVELVVRSFSIRHYEQPN